MIYRRRDWVLAARPVARLKRAAFAAADLDSRRCRCVFSTTEKARLLSGLKRLVDAMDEVVAEQV